MTPDREAVLDAGGAFDLRTTLAPLRMGPHDPTTRLDTDAFWRATPTPVGPATLCIERPGPSGTRVAAWGPGADWVVEQAGRMLGTPTPTPAAIRDHPVLGPVARSVRTLRLPVAPSLVVVGYTVILQQRVRWREAAGAYRRLVEQLGDQAPGPGDLRLPPTPRALLDTPYYAMHPLGVDRRRADTLRRLCERAGRVEALRDAPVDEAKTKLGTIRGIGPWTVGMMAGLGLGDSDAVPIGDLKLPRTVAHALAGEPDGDDARMLELLEPFVGHRWYAIRLVWAATGVRGAPFTS